MGLRTIFFFIFLMVSGASMECLCSPLEWGEPNSVTDLASPVVNSGPSIILSDPTINLFELGMFLGFVIILLIYSFLIYVNIKQPIFLWYFLYTLVVSLYLVSSEVYLFDLKPIGLVYFKILIALAVFYAFIRFFQLIIDTKKMFWVQHQWMNYGFWLAMLISLLKLIFPDSKMLNLGYSLVQIGVIILVGVCLFHNRELSRIQEGLLKLSLLAMIFSGISMGLDSSQVWHSDTLLILGFVFMVIHIFSYSVAVLFRIKMLTDKKEFLWQEIRKSKSELLETYLDGVEVEKNRIGKELRFSVVSEFKELANSLQGKDSAAFNQIQQLTYDVMAVTTELNAAEKGSKSDLIHDIENLVAGHNGEGIKFEFKHFNYTHYLTSTCENHLFRIVQEAVQNIEKYAKATYVQIEIFQNETDFILSIEDNGVGFNSNKKRDGIGILNMKNRVAEMNGTFNLASSSGKGVSILIALAIKDD